MIRKLSLRTRVRIRTAIVQAQGPLIRLLNLMSRGAYYMVPRCTCTKCIRRCMYDPDVRSPTGECRWCHEGQHI